MVPCMTGTFIRFFFASSIPLVIASCTSLALPRPWPTTPFSFPTTTNAEKLNARPPLVVFTTRLIATTFSFSSRSPALTLFKITCAIVIIYECYLQITFPDPIIKIEVRLHGHLQRQPLHGHD